MTSNTGLTRYQLLARVQRETGICLQVRALDCITQVRESGDTISLAIRVARTRQTARRTRIVGYGTRLVQLTCDQGRWAYSDFTLWDQQPVCIELIEYGRVVTPAEFWEQAGWEAICYRPGDGSRLGERDSFDRECQGY